MTNPFLAKSNFKEDAILLIKFKFSDLTEGSNGVSLETLVNTEYTDMFIKMADAARIQVSYNYFCYYASHFY